MPVVTLVALVTATVRVTAVRIVQPYTVSVVAYNGTSGQGPQALNAEPRTDYCTPSVLRLKSSVVVWSWRLGVCQVYQVCQGLRTSTLPLEKQHCYSPSVRVAESTCDVGVSKTAREGIG